MRTSRKGQSPRGMSLIEILMVVVLMSVMAAALVPQFQPNVASQLESVAQIVAADLDYARSLAVANGSTYRVALDVAGQRYVLTHSGTNPMLDVLPPAPFRKPGDPPDQHIVELADLPRFGPLVELAGAQKVAGSTQVVTDVEFAPLGGTTRSETTLVWLACGQGGDRRYLPIAVDPVTGVTSIGELQLNRPAGLTR
ncbi:MAG: prepilin-type N-terminal cleavage/methylation domain-containing protein [Planctomycetes bacterium]|nr:prepilin-type N-terminal cleavage/methylation domain-containing protein [Planctomycetota bacterium]